MVKLDLKQTDRKFLDDLVTFLTPRAPREPVMISSRDRDALLYLHHRLSHIWLLFSIGFPDAVHTLRSVPVLLNAIHGVSVFQGLVDANLVTWLHAQKQLVVAWTVNDVRRLTELVRLGVDGVTTANLAILQALE